MTRLIGSPPGYVGHEDGGVDRNRHGHIKWCYLMKLKEHPDIQYFASGACEGRLTDGKGRQVDFRNTMILLTSNIGAEHCGMMTGPS